MTVITSRRRLDPSGALDAALETLASFAPGSADAAHLALAGALRPVRDWGSSRLTADGHPVELAFGPDPMEVRWTSEVADPDAPPAHRWARVEEQARTIDAMALTDPLELLARARGWQACGACRWSVWLGGRHNEAGSVAKVYAEVPGPATARCLAWVEEQLGLRLLLRDVLEPRMVGVTPTRGVAEVYFRATRVQVWEVERLLGCCQLGARMSELEDALCTLSQRPLTDSLPSRLGISLTLTTAEPRRPVAATLFMSAKTVTGPDSRTRERLLTLWDRPGFDVRPYAAVTSPLQRHVGHPTHHGPLALVVTTGRPVEVVAGLRPPLPSSSPQPG